MDIAEILARAAQREAELDQMHADYEAADQAEYEAYIDELDTRTAEHDA